MGILIIADDLTGAADCAIGFARSGTRSVVTLGGEPGIVADSIGALAVDTDTRRLSADVAAERVVSVHAWMGGGRRLYKKIDSTLRGNWAAEVAALQRVAGTAIVAPAHPDTGRTVRDGHVHVHGERLESTQIWKLEHAHRRAGIADQLDAVGLASDAVDADALQDRPADLARRIGTLVADGVQAIVVSAGTRQALRALAMATGSGAGNSFWVGSGGLSCEIAALHSRPGGAGASPKPSVSGPILILVGSLSQVSERQCARFRLGSAVKELVLIPEVLRAGPRHPDWDVLREKVGALLRKQTDLLVRIGRDDRFDPAEGALLAASMAKLIGPHLARAGGVIATGGETARAMLVEAGIDSLEVLCEVEAGVVVANPCFSDHRPAPRIVTKAGAFGSEHALYEAWRMLRGHGSRTPEEPVFPCINSLES